MTQNLNVRQTGGTRAMAHQRYYNKASGRMETKQAMGNYHRPVPAGHKLSKTTQTVTSVKPVFDPNKVGDWTKLNGTQLRAFAESLVNKDTKAATLPFQQQSARLSGEEANAHTRAVGMSATTQSLLGGIAGRQAESAKTAGNEAADILHKGEQGIQGVFANQGYVAPQVQQEKERAEALVKTTGAAFQQGSQARQSAESNYLANVQAASAQRAQEQQGQITSGYAKQKGVVNEKEAQRVAEAPAKVQELWLKLTGQKTALDEARAKLGIQVQKNQITAANNQAKNRIGARNAASGERRAATGEYSAKANAEYKRASAAEKKRLDDASIAQKKADIEKKLGSGPSGKPLTPLQQNAYSGEFATALNVFQRYRAAGAPPKVIREALGTGIIRDPKGNKLKVEKVKNPVFIQAAEELMQKRMVGSKTKQRLREMGVKDSGWSDLFLNEAQGVTGSARTR